MRTWSVGVGTRCSGCAAKANEVCKCPAPEPPDENRYVLTVDLVPWWAVFLERVVPCCEQLVPGWIPLPKFIKIRDEDGELHTMDEYYGGLSGLVHVYFCMKWTNWIYQFWNRAASVDITRKQAIALLGEKEVVELETCDV